MNEIETWFEDHFGKTVAEVKADLAKADGFAVEHAPALEKTLGSIVGALKVFAPAVGDEASEVVSGAEKAFTDLQALYKRYFGAKG